MSCTLPPLSILRPPAALPKLTGSQAGLIIHRLKSLDGAELERIKRTSILHEFAEAGGQLPDSDATALDPSRLTIGRLKKDGYIHERGDTWLLIAKGRRFLEGKVRTGDGDPESRDDFVLERLGESLRVTCPTCGSILAGLWPRPTLSCPSCHHRSAIEESPAVTVDGRIPAEALGGN
jgi:hypothetical protein